MFKILSVLLGLVITTFAAHAQTIELEWLQERIFNHETGGQLDKLLYWSEAEEFPSLGIGHFIWVPKKVTVPFDPSFPAMVAFVAKRTNLATPDWMRSSSPPWKNRAAFQRDLGSSAMKELRRWLEETRAEQAEFIVHRFTTRAKLIFDSMPNIMLTSDTIVHRYQQLMQTHYGQFALIDYNNFKGFGHLPNERYNGVGWGILQVLEAMNEPTGQAANNPICWVRPFAEAAETVLQRRVAASSPSRQEARWLPGWKNRLTTYWQEIPASQRRVCE